MDKKQVFINKLSGLFIRMGKIADEMEAIDEREDYERNAEYKALEKEFVELLDKAIPGEDHSSLLEMYAEPTMVGGELRSDIRANIPADFVRTCAADLQKETTK